jgi:hypothetical protein
MQEPMPIVRLKINRRWWHFAIISRDSFDDTPDVFTRVRRGGGVDLLLAGDDEQFGRELTERLVNSPDLEVRTVNLPPLEGLPPRSIVIGRRESLARFARSWVSSESLPMDDPDVISGTYPLLPDPTEIPPFPEAETADPFGQNPRLLHEAWVAAASNVGSLLRRAHAQGLSISLPKAPAGSKYLLMQPWRHVAPVKPSDEEEWEAAGRTWNDRALTPDEGLRLIQRCLVTTNAIAPDDEDMTWDSLAALLDVFGYTLLAAHVDVERIDNLRLHVRIGEFAAGLHARQTLHGDLHPGNFRFLGDELVGLEADEACTLDRPLTTAERAADLGPLKLNCRFEQWEAVKVGYSRVSPVPATEVFQYL